MAQGVVDVLRRAERRMPQGIRRLARDAGHRVLGHERGPLVSVVVTVTDLDRQYLAESLLMVREQSYPQLEILVAPYGDSTGAVSELTLSEAPDDYRLRLLDPSEDQAEARDRGGAAARGEYLCFLLGTDLLRHDAIRRLVDSLEDSGSDLAVGRIERRNVLAPPVVPPYDLVHDQHRKGLSLAEFPLALTDLVVCNRLFRASFWRNAALSFSSDEGADGVALGGYLKANRFDVLGSTVAVDMDRADGTPVEQLHDRTKGMDEWLVRARKTYAALADADLDVRRHWALGVLEWRVDQILGDVERMSEEQWSQLHDFVLDLERVVDADVRALLPVEARARLELLVAGRREELTEFVASRWFEQGNTRTTIVDGRVHAVYPGFELSAEATAMHEHETPARALIRDVRPLDNDRVVVDLLTRIELVDMAGRQPVVTARVVPDQVAPGIAPDEVAPEPIELEVSVGVDAQANMSVGHKYQDYRPGGSRIEMDLSRLARGSWHLEVTVTVDGVTRTTSAMKPDRRGPAGQLGTRNRPRVHCSSGNSVLYERTPDHRLSFIVKATPTVRLDDADIEGRTVTLRLGGSAPVRAILATGAGVEVEAPVEDGVARLTLPEHPAPPGPDGFWWLDAITYGDRERIACPDPVGTPWTGVGGGSVVVSRDGRGCAQVLEAADTIVLDRVTLGQGSVTVTGSWLGTRPKRARLTLAGGTRLSESVEIDTAGPDFEVTFSLYWDEWGLGRSVLPGGEYVFELTCGQDRAGLVRFTTAYLEHQAEFQVSDEVRLRPIRGAGGVPGLVLQPPIPVDHAGSYAHNQAREQVLAGIGPIDEKAVYLSTYAGSTATDSQKAIHEHLRRTRPDLTLYWGVADHASRVPEGGVPVVLNSPEWYRVIGTAKYLVQNIDFDRWWRKREGQQFLQTFHGYPAKSMGLRMWRAKMFTPLRQQAELDRTTAGWDLILTPAPEMDVHYRREYAYDGPIHSQGYPRDDALLLPTAEADRTRTRELLGIGPEQKVILYAPTWRDHLALNYRSAKLVEHLDVVAASEELGEEYVILLRGHRFNSKGSPRSERTARVIDVTDYPEINDLILASDAAVLDYSSLRFDFALTGRPMVFLVPDLADYTGGIRGFLFDYTDTAPGPLLETADQVVEALSDLDGLQAEYGARIADFNKLYQYTQDGKATERVVEAFFGPTPQG